MMPEASANYANSGCLASIGGKGNLRTINVSIMSAISALMTNPELMAQIADVTPLGRLAEPDEVAAAILFLASPAASMITGHILAVDGGFLAQ
jgi:NAD(P)-dependent dehydrogenase (short-subunit alcohol dehydrogenase family)